MAKDPKKVQVRVREFAQEHSLGPYYAGEVVELDVADLKQPHIRAAVITLEEEKREKEAKETADAAERRGRMEAREQERQSAIEAQKLGKARRATAEE